MNTSEKFYKHGRKLWAFKPGEVHKEDAQKQKRFSLISKLAKKFFGIFLGISVSKNKTIVKVESETDNNTNDFGDLGKKINEYIVLLFKWGIPATFLISFLAFNLVSLYPQFITMSRTVQTEYAGEYTPYQGEIHAQNGRALIVVHQGYASYNLIHRVVGIDSRKSYQEYQQHLESKISSYLSSGDIVVYIVGVDQYSKDEYPFGDNIIYLISNPTNSYPHSLVFDENNMFSQNTQISEILKQADVDSLEFSGEYAGACVEQAKTLFSDFEILTDDASVQYDP